jgi:hypothetical protein
VGLVGWVGNSPHLTHLPYLPYLTYFRGAANSDSPAAAVIARTSTITSIQTREPGK